MRSQGRKCGVRNALGLHVRWESARGRQSADRCDKPASECALYARAARCVKAQSTLRSARAPEDVKGIPLGPLPTRGVDKGYTCPSFRWCSRLSLQLRQWIFCHLPCHPPCYVQPHRWYIRCRLYSTEPSPPLSHRSLFHQLMGPPPPLPLHRAPLSRLTDKLLSSRWATGDRGIHFTTTRTGQPSG